MSNVRLVILSALLAGCLGGYSAQPGGGDDDPADPADDPAVANCEMGRSYVGIAGTPLEADRVPAAPGADRMRLKPYSALAAEYARVLGNTAADPTAFRATFGEPPPRWSTEPDASANTLYAAFSVAYQGCLAEVADAGYAEAPSAASADPACRDFAVRFWDRPAMDAEVAPCVALAEETSSWAYVCAAVLTAAGFLSY